ncbi:MAG: hypothetical protein ACRDHP_02375 [Ktedonobacterales bacterium]
MAYQITLSEEDYAALSAASASSGAPIEQLVHEAIATRFSAPAPVKQIGSYRYPTGEPITEAELAEIEKLAQEIGSEKPWLSDMVIEDRGPR